MAVVGQLYFYFYNTFIAMHLKEDLLLCIITEALKLKLQTINIIYENRASEKPPPMRILTCNFFVSKHVTFKLIER
jgi:hypothetical protein